METKRVLNASNREIPSEKTAPLDTVPVVQTLNHILEMELAGAVLYTHYSLTVFGHDRMQLVKWFEGQSSEAMSHARAAGELVTQLGSLPSLGIASLTQFTQNLKHDTTSILRNSLAFEKSALEHYAALLDLVQGKNVMLEEYARQFIYTEMQHIGELEKMLRGPAEFKGHEAA